MKETDLYPPVAAYLLEQGYTVRSEVKDCDVAAIKGEELVVVELKRHFSVDVLIQATARQNMSDQVFVAIPRPKRGMRGKHWQGIIRLVKKLELGLMVVSSSRSKVEVVVSPQPYTPKKRPQKRRAIIEEMAGRSQDLNVGGSSKLKLWTAYRENAAKIAAQLYVHGPLSARQLREMGFCQKTYSILYRNHYGWFSRESKGVYLLTELGRREVEKLPEFINKCCKKD